MRERKKKGLEKIKNVKRYTLQIKKKNSEKTHSLTIILFQSLSSFLSISL